MSGVTFERLPAERGALAGGAASAGSCCCCCCCCLHTLGSLIGAATAKPPIAPADNDLPTAVIGTPKAQPKYSVAREYWLTTLVMSLLAIPAFFVIFDVHEDLEAGGWLLYFALVMPIIQLAASAFVALRNAFSKRPGQRERLMHLGSITGRAFVGAFAGTVMVVLLAIMM